jgi:ABC-type multidrug transport system ATPase subunit
VIDLQELSVRFGRNYALRDVTVRFPQTGVISLVGPNGAGKSTLLDVISGVTTETSGRIVRFGAGTASTAWRRANVARLHQRRVVPDDVLVRDLLQLVLAPEESRWLFGRLRTKPFDLDEVNNRVGALLRAGKIEFGVQLRVLSWGQARMVALSATVLARKRLLLLDEPFTGLSEAARFEARNIIVRESASRAVIIAEHDVESVLAVSDSVATLVAGRLKWIRPASAVSPRSLLAAFI